MSAGMLSLSRQSLLRTGAPPPAAGSALPKRAPAPSGERAWHLSAAIFPVAST